MAPRFFLFAIFPFILIAAAAGEPDERESGLPFLRAYGPKEYGAQAQNWAVTQDQRGVIYVGNNDGVLIYDGVHWRTVPVSNMSVVRSLDVASDGTVYVGARGEFGYLAPDASGALRYVSLVDRVPAEDRGFKDVWRTIASPEGIVFSSYERLFRWKPGTGMRVWKGARRSFLANGSVYVQQMGAGLLRLEGDSLLPIPGGERFETDRIYCVAPHGYTSILIGSTTGIFLQNGGSIEPFPTEADALLNDSQAYSCGPTPGGGLVVATLRGGAVVLGPEGKLLRRLNRNTGLASDSVTFAYTDREGGLWLTMVAGFARVQAPAPLSFYDDRTGLKGSVLALTRQAQTLYAGTDVGLYRLQPSTTAESARFEPVESAKEPVFSLLSTAEGLLVGSSGSVPGVYQLDGSQLRLIRKSAGAVYHLLRSRRDPSIVYASGSDGLAMLRLTGGRWTDGGNVSGIKQALRKATEDGSGRLWLGSDFEGALRVNHLADAPSVEAFGAKEGLPAGLAYPSLVAGRIVILSKAGILAFDEKARRFSPDSVLGAILKDQAEQPTLLGEDPQGNVWIGAKTYGGVLRRQSDGGYRWDANPFRRMTITEIYAAHRDTDGAIWAGTAEGVVRYNPVVAKNYAVAFPALVRNVAALDGRTIHFAGAGVPSQPTLPFDANSLRFQFAAPSFEDEARTEYRVFLDGFDRGWSAWTQETRKDYTNVPEGHYTFRVAARNLYGATSQEAAYAFIVLAPWYRSWWGYILEGLAVAAVLSGLIRWRLRLLAEQNRRLQKTVEERTAELQEKNVTLTEVNHKLNMYNSEKNEFLGIAAHDLKNPLGAIRGYAEMLEEDAEEISKDEVVDFAGRIKKSANLMFDLVSNLLDVNRIEQGQMSLDLKPCDLWDTVRQAVEGYQQRAHAKQIRLLFDDQTTAPLVMADAAQLVQIMDNLVSNAVKYSPSAKSVYVRVHQTGSSVRAEVKDEGPGISAEDQKRLFGKFARLSARPTAGEHSTGLGLAIVKRLVEAMNGKVWCESEPGQGAAFIVELPVAVEVVASR